MWVYAKDERIIYEKKLYFNSDSSLSIELSNNERSLYYYFNPNCIATTWTFKSFSVYFLNSSTYISFTCDTSFKKIFTVYGYAFSDRNPGLQIKITYQYNLIYRMSIIQHYVSDLSEYQVICSTLGSASCLGPTNYNQFNYTDGRVLNCHPDCIHGCSTWGTCNSCKNVKCDTCYNFNDTCTENPSFSPCISGFILSDNNKTCCDQRCALCHGPKAYLCSKCANIFILFKTFCTYNCPSGFEMQNKRCINV